jgi:phage baseplate assembly protein V
MSKTKESIAESMRSFIQAHLEAVDHTPTSRADVARDYHDDVWLAICRGIVDEMYSLLRFGTVAQADYATGRVRVSSGDLLTEWIPWLTRRAAGDIDWWAPEVGEQVLLLALYDGPTRVVQTICLPAVYQEAYPPPENKATVRSVRFADGTRVAYDREASRLVVDCVGDIEISSAKHVKVNTIETIDISAPVVNIAAAVSITGSLSVVGNIQASGSVIDGGGNTNHHSH